MKIKQIPEDFIVNEIINLDLTKDRSDYSIFKLKKREWESFKIIEAISKALRTKTKFIGFAGNKDKQAITTQYISIYKIPRENIEKIKINGADISFVGYSRNRINLGDLKGNEFKITIRDLKEEIELPRNIQLENYFDEQRFGNKSNTHLVGKAILKRDFREACKLLGLVVKNNDYIGAIRQHQRRLLRFYISSYQSYLWNKILNEHLKEEKNTTNIRSNLGELIFSTSKLKNFKIPIINFDTKENKLIDKILNEEGIKKEDFIIKEMPELITEGKEREAFIEVKKIEYKWNKDELNKGKLKLQISFFLPKGCYATMLTKKLGTYLE